MRHSSVNQTGLPYKSAAAAGRSDKKGNLPLLRLIRGAQTISRAEIAKRLEIDKSEIGEQVKRLLANGILREETPVSDGEKKRRSKVLSLASDRDFFVGVNFGARASQVGMTTLDGEISFADDFVTPARAEDALQSARRNIEDFIAANAHKKLRVIGVSVPGATDSERRTLVSAPNLNWRGVNIAEAFDFGTDVKVVVENDAAAAAMYEARMKIAAASKDDNSPANFILVRSGTGISVSLVIGGEIYRGGGDAAGAGFGRGIAGEFGHMTIVAGGKSCVCGNRGCWEKYASAASAALLYLGDRPIRPGETLPRFVEIVAKAENGDIRSKRTLEKIGDYLGIGVANAMMGVGLPRVIVSGRSVYGWKFIERPLREAIGRSVVGRLKGWSVEAGDPFGAALGGALEAAVEEYLTSVSVA